MNIGISLKTLGQSYQALDDFFQMAEQSNWTLKSINCTLTKTLRFKYILLVERTDQKPIDQEKLFDFTQALALEFNLTLDAEVYSTNCSFISRDGLTGMVELIIA